MRICDEVRIIEEEALGGHLVDRGVHRVMIHWESKSQIRHVGLNLTARYIELAPILLSAVDAMVWVDLGQFFLEQIEVVEGHTDERVARVD